MNIPLLSIKSLQVTVESKTVIDNLSLQVNKGEVVAITGSNGSGKSSLAMTLLGDPKYRVSSAKATVSFESYNLLLMTPDERSRKGLFVAWQNPVTIPGVSVFSLCKASCEAHGSNISELVAFKNKIEQLITRVGLSKEYVGRNVNEGFSGGERKRLELMQLLLLEPKLAVLDEIDSGLDANGLKIVVEIVNEMKDRGISFILITHNKKLLDEIHVDKVVEMKYGKISTGI